MKTKPNLRLLNAMKEKGLTKKAVSEQSPISESMLSLAVNGRFVPSDKHKERLARVLSKKVEDLF